MASDVENHPSVRPPAAEDAKKTTIRDDNFAVDTLRCVEDIDRLELSLFNDRTDVTAVKAQPTASPLITQLSSPQQIDEFLQQDFARLDLISLCKLNSRAGFSISKSILLKVLRKYEIGPVFLDLLLHFRSEGHWTAESFNCRSARTGETGKLSTLGSFALARTQYTDRVKAVCYELQYVEHSDRGHGSPWAKRRVGVYHELRPAQRNDVLILLHVGRRSRAYERIVTDQVANGRAHVLSQAIRRPFLVHNLVISSYLRNWRWYLSHLAERCVHFENGGFTARVEDEDHYDASLTFDRLQEIRNLEAELATTLSMLDATLQTLHELEAFIGLLEAKTGPFPAENVHGQILHLLQTAEDKMALANFVTETKGYLNSVRAVQARVDKLAQISVDGLNQKCHLTAAAISQSLVDLGQKSLDDNVTVRIITVITLIYLPTQFVAAFFGTNFVAFKQEQRRIEFSHDWWIFFAMATPLTLATLAIWWFTIQRRLKGKAKLAKAFSKAEDVV